MSQIKEKNRPQVLKAVSEIERFIDKYKRGDLAPEEAASGTLVADLRNDVARGGAVGQKDDPWLGDVPDANYPDAN